MSHSKADELARACAAAMYTRDLATQALGISISEIRHGYACMKMRVRADMLNGHDICHGGFIFALADNAFAYACNTHDKVTVAQSCDIDFIQAGKKDDELTAVAEERTRSGRTGLYDVTVRRSDGEILALFRGRSYQVKGALLKE